MLRKLVSLIFLFLVLACGQERTPGEVATVPPGISFFTASDGVKIAFTDEGEGQPVVLIHGFLNSGANWDRTELKTQLLAAGYRVIVPDLRGNGYSDKPQTDSAYAKDAEVKDLLSLADHLALKTYQAVGYSRGSIVLAKLLTQDARITSAVLGGMGLDFTDPDWPRRKLFAAAFAGNVTEETEEAVEYAKSIQADLRSLALQQQYQPVTSPEELRQVELPVLVIAGSEDKDNGDPGALERQFPAGKLAIVPGDHNNTYRSMVFAAAVMAFIKSTSSQ